MVAKTLVMTVMYISQTLHKTMKTSRIRAL